MDKDFSISSTVFAPAGWTSVITAPTSGQTLPTGGTGWVGIIDYYIGTGDAVEIGETGDFGFKVSFLGDVAFCTEQTPTPEPATVILLAMGSAALLRKKR
jgi:PEP-CTERM motif-containing protein